MTLVQFKGDCFCPLCDDKMTRREVVLHDKQARILGKKATIFLCRPCNIGIYDFDPAFNKWRDTDKVIPCPHCQAPLKWFARYMDGFFKAVCPECKCELKKDGDVRFDKGRIIIPDEMDEEIDEPPVELKIPLAHLAKKFGFGKDKIDALKKKFRKKDS